eukprot:3820438-Alexandrium_andersonii.AAC.1
MAPLARIRGSGPGVRGVGSTPGARRKLPQTNWSARGTARSVVLLKALKTAPKMPQAASAAVTHLALYSGSYPTHLSRDSACVALCSADLSAAWAPLLAWRWSGNGISLEVHSGLPLP